MKRLLSGFLLTALALSGEPLLAQVPYLITYQGRVTSGGAAFTGTGQFKFALINIAGTTNFLWRNDGNNTTPGEPSVSVAVPVTNGLFTVVLGDTTLAGMAAIPPSVFSNSAVYLRIWFNDGVNGSAQLVPDQRITAVAYAVLADGVRDGAITANKIAAGAIDATKLSVGAAASNLFASGQSSVGIGGVILSEQAANTNLANAGYVRIGKVDLIDESWQPRANGPPRTLAVPLARSHHTAVWTGTEMIIWGGASENGLENTGGRYNPTLNTWTPTSITTNTPAVRFDHSAIWTGSEMIIFGGEANDTSFGGTGGPITLDSGARYNPASDTWVVIPPSGIPRRNHAAAWSGIYMTVWGGTSTGCGFFGCSDSPRTDGGRYRLDSNAWFSVSTVNAPSGRKESSYVWTGSELIIWGGYVDVGSFITTRSNLNTGARYNPVSDVWTQTTTAGAPNPRYGHVAVWTGSQMLVWSGVEGDGASFTNVITGARYSPSGNSWTGMATNGAPQARTGETAIWDGSRMIVWAGINDTNYLDTGGRYFPANNTWSNVNFVARPAARAGHQAVWTGTEMIVWGGGNDILLLDLGGRYNPATDSWVATPLTGERVRRAYHTAVWTGTEMIAWGGFSGETYLNNGGRFNPALNSWTALPLTGAPEGRYLHTAVWSGNEMIVWGGYNGSILNTGGRYNPATNGWNATTTNNAPAARFGHTAVWADTTMIVWGGTGSGFLNSGARYNPAANSWTPTTLSSAPAVRSGHSAVWTGSEMIIWGGAGGTIVSPFALATGARYRLASNSWTSLPTTGAPVARSAHKAVWTAHEMLVWGGGFGTNYYDTGGKYDPGANSWSAFDTNNAPTGRAGHTAVWDGAHMIVWGGNNDSGYFRDGGRYDPIESVWSDTLFSTNTPSNRTAHTAVWTGTEMLIHGGFDGQTYFDSTSSYVPPRRMFLYLKP